MSQTEIHIGKLRLITLPESQSIEDWCKEKCNSKLSSYNKTWREQLMDDFSNTYFIIDGKIYEAFNHKKFNDDDDISYLKDNGDGTFDFIMKFYNGSCYLSECMGDAVIKTL